LQIQEHYKASSHPHAETCSKIWEADWAYLHVPAHSAAYVLHPKYQSERLQENDDVWNDFMDVCLKMLGPEQGALAVAQYSLYQEHQGRFGHAMTIGGQLTVPTHHN